MVYNNLLGTFVYKYNLLWDHYDVLDSHNIINIGLYILTLKMLSSKYLWVAFTWVKNEAWLTTSIVREIVWQGGCCWIHWNILGLRINVWINLICVYKQYNCSFLSLGHINYSWFITQKIIQSKQQIIQASDKSEIQYNWVTDNAKLAHIFQMDSAVIPSIWCRIIAL